MLISPPQRLYECGMGPMPPHIAKERELNPEKRPKDNFFTYLVCIMHLASAGLPSLSQGSLPTVHGCLHDHRLWVRQGSNQEESRG